MKKNIDGEELNIPEHVAIIMDGNGRWAKKRLMPRNFGHKAGAKVVEQICEDAYDLGIRYLTVYAFSTENWKRSVEEVTGIMNLLRNYLVDCIERASKNNMRVRVIGDRSALAEDIVEKIDELEKKTACCDGLNFTIALNYGGRDEIVRAARAFSQEVSEGKRAPEELTEEIFSQYLYSSGVPDPELIIRPSGEKRISNFLLWQSAYSEYVFMNVLWPDFSPKDLDKAIEEYHRRNRRFGGT